MSVFPECFQIKYSRNLLGSKYDSTMVTFNSCTVRLRSWPPQILAGIWFYLFHFRKWRVLVQKDNVFWCEIALLSASFACSCKSNAVCWRDILSFHDSAIPATQRSYIFIKYQHWLYTHSHFKSFDVAYLQLRVELHSRRTFLNWCSCLTF